MKTTFKKAMVCGFMGFGLASLVPTNTVNTELVDEVQDFTIEIEEISPDQNISYSFNGLADAVIGSDGGLISYNLVKHIPEIGHVEGQVHPVDPDEWRSYVDV